MLEDAELLRRYAEDRTEEAFAELVRRHVDFVYGVAVRQLGGDRHLAEDVCQDVFTALAAKASLLSRRAVLAGWLHTAARYSASHRIRAEKRRREREAEAYSMIQLDSDSPGSENWVKLRPAIDGAIGQLNERDRAAILLRFFHNCSYPEIATKIGATDVGARLRVDRALGRLNATLSSRGIKSSAGALALALAGQSAIAAPPALVASIVSTASAAAVGSGLVAPIYFMTATQLKIALVGTLLLGGGAALVLQHRENARLQRDLEGLSKANAPLADLRGENARLSRALADAGSLHRDAADPAQISSKLGGNPGPASSAIAAAALPPGWVAPGQLRNQGLASPAAAFETLYWAKIQLDFEVLEKAMVLPPKMIAAAQAAFDQMTPEERAALPPAVDSPERLALYRWATQNNPELAGMSLDEVEPVNDGQVNLTGRLKSVSGGYSNYDYTATQTPDGWRISPKLPQRPGEGAAGTAPSGKEGP